MASLLTELFSDLDAVFDRTSARWYVFGAQAAIVHGATRLTADVDIILGGPGLEEQFMQRAQQHDLAGVMVPIASGEDIIAMKILAGRGKDLDDALAIIMAQGERLDLLTSAQH